jgi:hypothetical protein
MNRASATALKPDLISFRRKGEPGTKEFMKLHRKPAHVSKSPSKRMIIADFVVDKTTKPAEYDPYNDPFLQQFFQRPSAIRSMIKSGIVRHNFIIFRLMMS